jgi:pyridoxal 5'-phosphate synthase pdxT subunit
MAAETASVETAESVGAPAAGGPVGVLALQGDFAAHAHALQAAGAATREVRRTADLAGLAGLVLPGGESTTLLNLMRDEPWFDAIRQFHAGGGALFGTCAGAILLSRDVRMAGSTVAQESLGLLDAVIERNAFGRQLDSFEAEVDSEELGALPAVFIRAPRFRELGPNVKVIARWKGEPVAVQQGNILAATFHGELTKDVKLQAFFLRRIIRGGPVE